MRGRVVFTVVAALGIAVVGTFASGFEGEPERTFVVLVEDGGDVDAVARAVADVGGAVTRTSRQIGMIVATSGERDFAETLRGIDGVESAGPSLAYRSALLMGTDETLHGVGPSMTFAQEAAVRALNPPNGAEDDPNFDAQWNLDAIDAPEAWDTGERGAKATVFVLDTGIASTHPDIAPNLDTSLCTSFVPGEDYDALVTQPLRPLPFFNHGTHVAGIIGAADNAFGVIGVAPEVELVAVKVLSQVNGFGYTDWIAAGIVYAADNGADVINMSLGGTVRRRGYTETGTTPGDPSDDYWVPAQDVAADINVWNRALSYAHNKGVTIIVSAGNDLADANKDKDAVIIPAQLPNVISVSATAPKQWAYDQTTDLDLPASYSNYGPSLVDLSAPGGDLDPDLLPWTLATVGRVTGPDVAFDFVFSDSPGGWFWAAGTSMAAPHVSGVAALIISKNGGSMKPAAVFAALKKSSDDIGSNGRDDFYGHGRVNAHNAVK